MPIAVLQDELDELERRRASDSGFACGSADKTKSYNTPLHVFALILILGLSTLGEACPYVSCSLFTGVLTFNSMLLPNHRPPLSATSDTSPFPIPFPPFRHRGAYCDCLCSPSPDRICLPDRSMSPALLECWLSGNGRFNCYDLGTNGSYN